MSAPTGLITLIGALIGLGIYFAPSALAILKGNVFKGQVIKFQIIILVITIVVVALVSVLVIFLPANAETEHNEMKTVSVTNNTTMAEPEAETSTAGSASGGILSTICIICGGIWLLTSIVLWFYILIHALRDQQMTLLSRFGINI